MNIAPLGREATLEDLYRVEGKAELVDGKLLLMSPGGDFHGYASTGISTSLRIFERTHGGGRAYGDGTAFIANSRRTFSPDAAWFVGPSSRTKVITGVPVFVAEVRSEDDYGLVAERRMATKRADYFASGTMVVWDVDVLREGVVRVYFAGGTRVVWDVQPRELQVRVHRAEDPANPTVYRYHAREVAEAEPAVPGWRVPLDELLD